MVQASAFLGLKRDKSSCAIFLFFGKQQKFTLEQDLFSIIRAGAVTSDGLLPFSGIPY